MGTFFELGKAEAAKGEEWAPPFISCAQDTVGLLTPTAPKAIKKWETFTFFKKLNMHIMTLTLIRRSLIGSEAQHFTTDFSLALQFNPAPVYHSLHCLLPNRGTGYVYLIGVLSGFNSCLLGK